MSEPAVQKLIATLARLRGNRDDAVVVFDGDGTLWHGDVGEDVFRAAIKNGLLRDECRPALLAFAEEHRVAHSAPADSGELALELFHAYERGDAPEREICEMMAWCYAGWTRDELRDHASRVFEDVALRARLKPQLIEVIEWARQQGVRTLIISASPQEVVEAAGQLAGFDRRDVFGARAQGEEVIRPLPDRPIPYGPGKAALGKAQVASGLWLAAFGDSGFDAAMMRTARVAVAVDPKPTLIAELSSMQNPVTLLS